MVGRPTEEFPWLFAGYALLPGRTACSAALTEDQRMALAEPLGRFLAALHSLPGAASFGAPPDRLGRLNLAKRRPQTREGLDRLAGMDLIDSPAPWLGIIEAVEGRQPGAALVLIHGDLYARHLLVDEQGRLCGVIDWGDVHLGDPALDLSISHSFLPTAAHAAFRNAYGKIDAETWTLARFRALAHTVTLMPYARETGDADLLREARLSLAHLWGV